MVTAMNLESGILASQPTIPRVTTCKLAALVSVFLSVKWGNFSFFPSTSKAYVWTIDYSRVTANFRTFCAVTELLLAFSFKAYKFNLGIILGFEWLTVTAEGSLKGVFPHGFWATWPTALVLANGSRNIFQNMKPKSPDAVQENNITESHWWLSLVLSLGLHHNISNWYHLKNTVKNTVGIPM